MNKLTKAENHATAAANGVRAGMPRASARPCLLRDVVRSIRFIGRTVVVAAEIVEIVSCGLALL
jgi:hypothetical protein